MISPRSDQLRGSYSTIGRYLHSRGAGKNTNLPAQSRCGNGRNHHRWQKVQAAGPVFRSRPGGHSRDLPGSENHAVIRRRPVKAPPRRCGRTGSDGRRGSGLAPPPQPSRVRRLWWTALRPHSFVVSVPTTTNTRRWGGASRLGFGGSWLGPGVRGRLRRRVPVGDQGAGRGPGGCRLGGGRSSRRVRGWWGCAGRWGCAQGRRVRHGVAALTNLLFARAPLLPAEHAAIINALPAPNHAGPTDPAPEPPPAPSHPPPGPRSPGTNVAPPSPARRGWGLPGPGVVARDR